MFKLGYNTNGLAHHRPVDALRLLAELGYEGMALSPDVGNLVPGAEDQLVTSDLKSWSEDLGVELSVETGARFVLDARRKHRPTMLENDPSERMSRLIFLQHSVHLAHNLGARVCSIWSGVAPPDAEPEQVWERLCRGVEHLLDYGRGLGVQIAFEPEPGMFIERPAGYLELLERMGSAADELGLCLDVGHLLCTGDLPVGDQIRTLAPRLVHVHLDDIAGGVHEHRMFGEGDLDLREALDALIEVGFDGMAAVELSRDSHRGAWAAEEAMRHLRAALGGG